QRVHHLLGSGHEGKTIIRQYTYCQVYLRRPNQASMCNLSVGEVPFAIREPMSVSDTSRGSRQFEALEDYRAGRIVKGGSAGRGAVLQGLIADSFRVFVAKIL